MPIKNVKLYKNGSWEFIQEDRVERFLEEGWTRENNGSIQEKKSPVKRGKKNKITANAQVTSTEVDNEEEWDPLTGEEWADSIESVSAPEGERLSDIDNETANKED